MSFTPARAETDDRVARLDRHYSCSGCQYKWADDIEKYHALERDEEGCERVCGSIPKKNPS